jgi:hypothetical protein
MWISNLIVASTPYIAVLTLLLGLIFGISWVNLHDAIRKRYKEFGQMFLFSLGALSIGVLLAIFSDWLHYSVNPIRFDASFVPQPYPFLHSLEQLAGMGAAFLWAVGGIALISCMIALIREARRQRGDHG